MLLRSTKSSQGNRMNHPLNPAHQKLMSHRAKLIAEAYEPKEKRILKKNEAQKAHFHLGMD